MDNFRYFSIKTWMLGEAILMSLWRTLENYLLIITKYPPLFHWSYSDFYMR